MLLRNRAPRIESRPENSAAGFEHLADTSIAVIRWLNANRVDFVLVGPVARAIRGDASARGAVAIVPAPYGRNLDRLARALWSAHARLRVDREAARPGVDETSPIRLTADKLLAPERWTLRCGIHELDIEGHTSGSPRYQELLYEATRFELAPEVSVEVAALQDVEHFDHVRRAGGTPEIRVTRTVRAPELH